MVRRFVLAVSLVSLLATMVVGTGMSKGSPMNFKVRIIQEATYRHPHPPDGNEGDVFSTTLRLFAIGPLLGKPDKAFVGTMSFSYTFQGVCSSSGAGCKGTTDIQTLSKLPGGTITANGSKVSLGHLPYVVPIVSGTGIFAGAKGTVLIAPSGAAEDVYDIKFS